MSVGAFLAIVGMVLSIVFWVTHAMPEIYAAMFWLAFASILLYGVTSTWPWHRN